MGVTLDGQNLFDGQEVRFELSSLRRDASERTVPGLDGVLSIDMGGRSRKIKQTGVLRAKSKLQMDERILAISAYMDGDTHKLITDSGEEFDSMRMDIFKTTGRRASGGGLAVDYEIIYTQLAV
jgi:hypothetical protein